MKLLGEKHTVTLICEQRAYQSEKDKEAVEKICHKVITVPRRKQWSIANITHALFSSDSFLITGHTNSELRECIQKELQEHSYNVIHIETSYVMQNLPADNTIPVVLVEHNIEYQVYERFMKKTPRVLHPLLRADIQKLKHTEELFWKKADMVVAVSDQEKKIIGLPSTAVVPNGVDLNTFKFKKKSPSAEEVKKILFIGDFSWIQNRDTAEWIMKEIWPKISSECRINNSELNIKLWIVGREIPERIKKLADNSIIIDQGNPRTTQEIFQEAEILLAPIRVGGGTSYKILESMAVGTPVVTTRLGNEGIDALSGKEILIGDTENELAQHVVTLISDRKLFEHIAEHARVVIEKKFSWENIVKVLDNSYASVVKKI